MVCMSKCRSHSTQPTIFFFTFSNQTQIILTKSSLTLGFILYEGKKKKIFWHITNLNLLYIKFDREKSETSPHKDKILNTKVEMWNTRGTARVANSMAAVLINETNKNIFLTFSIHNNVC